jgi:polyisoprenoid-binding protein YceI
MFERSRTTCSFTLPILLLLTACAGERPPGNAAVVERAAAPVETAAVADGSDAAVRLEVLPNGNEVRYRVREQLVGLELPNDAVGRTNAITGGISLDDAGRVIPGESAFVIQVAGLTSDKERRDGYLRRRTLVTDSNPSVVLRPTSLRGLTFPLPSVGTRTFELAGDLTIKGVTRPTTWRVNATFAGDTVSGTTATAFTFADFQLEQPKVRVVLSVADTIGLEYDFRLLKQP